MCYFFYWTRPICALPIMKMSELLWSLCRSGRAVDFMDYPMRNLPFLDRLCIETRALFKAPFPAGTQLRLFLRSKRGPCCPPLILLMRLCRRRSPRERLPVSKTLLFDTCMQNIHHQHMNNNHLFMKAIHLRLCLQEPCLRATEASRCLS